MAQPLPKVLLFDIGGVCVVSPLQAILEYETSKHIPPGYINFAISRGAPNGSWHRLERGEVALDSAFFEDFNKDLSRQAVWEEFHVKLGHKQSGRDVGPRGSGHAAIPRIPDINAELLFWEMMRTSREPDPYMYPALKKLKADGKFLLAALSNTVIFPPDHPYSQKDETGVRSMFDLFISSAHVGMRKPDPQIYDYAIWKLRDLARDRGFLHGLSPDEIIFLDDIGENLKWGKKAGMRTIRVKLGKTRDAVTELERVTGLNLTSEHEQAGEKARL